MTAAQMVRIINHTAFWRHEGLDIPVRVMDVRKVFGRTDYLITPVSGDGTKWVEDASVIINEEA